MWTAIVLSAAVGYFMGCFNPSYLIARVRGFDIRERGSGNAGASNAVITMSKTAGIITALLDIFKAFAAVKLASALFPSPGFCGILAGAFCMLGHIFPIFMSFRGGKGLACLGGVILAYNPVLFVVMLAVEAVMALATDYICFVPMTAAAAFPVIYFCIERAAAGALILAAVAVVVELKHVENLRRISDGKEMHLSFLWNKNAEIERLSLSDSDDSSAAAQ